MHSRHAASIWIFLPPRDRNSCSGPDDMSKTREGTAVMRRVLAMPLTGRDFGKLVELALRMPSASDKASPAKEDGDRVA